jgi:hypothetical protein
MSTRVIGVLFLAGTLAAPGCATDSYGRYRDDYQDSQTIGVLVAAAVIGTVIGLSLADDDFDHGHGHHDGGHIGHHR